MRRIDGSSMVGYKTKATFHAKRSEVEIAKGLTLGGDASITKPLQNVELVAPVKMVLENTFEKAVRYIPRD